MGFIEILNQHYDDMLQLRESLGYSIGKNPQIVREFIVFCGTNYPNGSSVTKEMLDVWLESKSFKTNSTHNFAITKIRNFLKYLASIGETAFLPDQDYSVRVVRYVPYIFTDEELSRLFAAVDSLPPSCHSLNREYIIPVLFRMMYCCGMRPSEPPSILIEDVNLKTGEIYIRQSKGYKDRRVLMSEDLKVLCQKYVSRMMPQKYFFERTPGAKINSEWVTNQFHLCWKHSQLPKRGNPRPYDLRHNFAARTMMRWLDEGKDISALVSYLSTYMGHTEFSATLYYIHLLPERLLKSPGIDWGQFSSIYPEVCHEQHQ